MEVFVNTKSQTPISVLIIVAIISMGIAIYFCTRIETSYWLLGQVLLSLAILQSFFLLQRFGKGQEIESAPLNAIGGHIASFFCLLPFNQWRMLNTVTLHNQQAIAIEKKFLPPLNVVAYSVKNYWNIKKLFGLFPDKKTRIKFILSMLVMQTFFLVVMPNIPGFWKKFGLGYFLFLLLAERWLIKQKALKQNS